MSLLQRSDLDTMQISENIEQLVDHFRADRAREVSLGDVAAVTEVLISTMERYFGSINTAVCREFRAIIEHIGQARQEIAHLRPNELKGKRIPEAGRELEAIVQSTEEATGTIMDAAEEIMGADSTTPEGGQLLNDACMRIFEACSFQDITGQRISKVVSTLTFIEERLNLLQRTWGPEIADEVDAPVAEEEDDSVLLNGPALAGEGNDQDAVDNLFGGATPAVATNSESLDAAPSQVVETAAAAAETPEAEPENQPGPTSTTASQAEIDALFD